MNYERDERQFLEAMATRFCFNSTRRDVFIQRFLEQNASKSYKELGALKQLNLCDYNVKDHLKNICDTIAAETGCDYGDRKKGLWEKAKAYLREKVYPEWQKQHQPEVKSLDELWRNFVSKAKRDLNWIQFDPIEIDRKGIKELRRNSIKIPLDEPAIMGLDLPYPGQFLLLLNRGRDTRYCLCPSRAFAPQFVLGNEVVWLPQEEAEFGQITFDTVGKEEFLAIVLPQPLALPWLNTQGENIAPIWDAIKLNEVWEHLQQKENWLAFYQEFEVG
ncbi:MAG: hypothetical protein J7647_25125 [Cyanobacteria bacterium SBLK]|nr:hypothetical protein [Cyanobacteria bacterium SBLK]